ncbi:MAG TPA: OB-fold domain-containing protein [Acidimicrobiales bacterium]
MTELRTTETKLEFPYSRTLGPVMGPFLLGLRKGKLLGIKSSDGRVLVPPVEYDPDTGDALGPDLVPVGPGGTVEAWTWVDDPSPKHPIQRPFAFALVKPDGADTALASPVDAGSIDAMATGMRVQARFSEEPHGLITDLSWEPAKS